MSRNAVLLASHVLAGLLGLLFLLTGLAKLGAAEPTVELFTRWGYPGWFMRLTGAAELFAALMLWWPRTRTLGAAVAGCVMAGATLTHALHDGIGPAAFTAVVGCLALTCAGLYRFVNGTDA